MPLLRPLWGETRWSSLFIQHMGAPPFHPLPEELSVKCDHVITVNGGDKASTCLLRYSSSILSTSTSMELHEISSNILAECPNRVFINITEGDALSIQSLKLLFAEDDKCDYYFLTISYILFNCSIANSSSTFTSGVGPVFPRGSNLDGSMEFASSVSLDYCMQDLRTGLSYPLTAAGPIPITFPYLTHLSLSSNSQPMTGDDVMKYAFIPARTVTHLTLFADSTGFTWATRECVM